MDNKDELLAFKKTRISICTNNISVSFDDSNDCVMLDITTEDINGIRIGNAIFTYGEFNNRLILKDRYIILSSPDKSNTRIATVYIPADEYLCAYENNKVIYFEYIKIDTQIDEYIKDNSVYPIFKYDVQQVDNFMFRVLISAKGMPKDVYWTDIYSNNVPINKLQEVLDISKYTNIKDILRVLFTNSDKKFNISNKYSKHLDCVIQDLGLYTGSYIIPFTALQDFDIEVVDSDDQKE